ncbi:hypothetical protein PCAU_1948 [Pseudomonas chlororaphis subsp. aurantiaca]|nr:hypothetical protein PCAU_1948 [Pseudomonas chlororaphis subsp. aurantiaca]
MRLRSRVLAGDVLTVRQSYRTQKNGKDSMKKMMIAGIVALIAVLIYTQITIFVVPPIGAVPEGRTVIMLRLNKTNFIDSADAMCDRLQGGVSLLCRGITIGAVVSKTKIIARLPYSEWLYLVSTGGKRYER